MEIILSYLIAVIFTLAILGKLTGKTKSTFEKAGFPPIFMYATALGEAVFSIGLFTQYTIFAAFGLLGIMGGAIFTLFRQKEKAAKYSLAILAVILLVAYLASKFHFINHYDS